MSKRSSCRSTDDHRSQKQARPFVATAAAIGGAGLVLATPVAALLASSGEVHAAPVTPASDQLFGCNLGAPTLGGTCDADPVPSASNDMTLFVSPSIFGNPVGVDPLDAVLDLAGAIPILNIFIGNGADGTAAHPNGFNGGQLIGSGGDGFSPTTAGAHGGNGGNGGAGGTGGDGSAGQDGLHGTKGDAGAP